MIGPLGLADLLVAAGFVAVLVGLWLVTPPLALIVGGLGLALVGFKIAGTESRKEPTP